MKTHRRNSIVYQPASVLHAPALDPPNKRVPIGWSAVPIGGADNPLIIKWNADASAVRMDRHARMRISIAIEIREQLIVEAYLLNTDTVLGTFDIRYAYVFQPFEIHLTPKQTKAALSEGVGLRIINSSNALWIFDALAGNPNKSFFTPHLCQGETARLEDALLERMLSLSSLQPFGWFEGCVLDGLYDLRAIAGAEKAERVIWQHLQQYILPDRTLQFEDLHGRPSDGKFSGNESTLPMAVLAKLQPEHPLVQQVIAYWPTLSTRAATTAESAYTVGYPMAVIATRVRSEELAHAAMAQILHRRDRLIDGDDLYGIVYTESQQRTMRNWARSYTWYMLGMIRTWSELHATSDYAGLEGMNEIAQEFQRIAQVALARRESNGLWACFLGESETGIETSGSAGIAAALALGAKQGLLPQQAFDAAREALEALKAYLTPDGLLSGVCQHNCGGLSLQREGYRTLSQMGMGLMSQLFAAVHAPAIP